MVGVDEEEVRTAGRAANVDHQSVTCRPSAVAPFLVADLSIRDCTTNGLLDTAELHCSTLAWSGTIAAPPSAESMAQQQHDSAKSCTCSRTILPCAQSAHSLAVW